MSYHGDIRLSDTIDVKFTSRAFASGAPTTLAGTPSVAAYPANSTTEITAGITLSVDFDSRTGLNNVRVVASSGNGYATATNYELVITAGTVGGTSVVGEVVGSFSIENRSALMPTTAGRTLVVDAAGLGDANTVKVGPTGAGTAQTAGDIPARLPAALTANGNIKASLVEILTTALTETAGQLAGGFKKFFNIATPAATMDHGVLVDTVTTVTNQLTAAQVATGIWQDTTAGDFTVALSVGKSVMNGVSLGTGLKIAECVLVDTLTTYTGDTPQTGDSYARIGANGVGLSAIPDMAGVTTLLGRLTATRAGYLDNLSAGAVALASGVTVTTNNDKTGYSIGSGGIGSAALTAAAVNLIADGFLDRNMATGTDSSTDSTVTRTPRQALRVLRNKVSITAGTATVTKEDDSTASWTAAVATAAGNPISAVDPT